MTSCEEKKALPPAEVSPGGVYPDEIDAIKKKAREGRLHRLRIPVAVAGVSLVILAVVGGTLLGLHLNREPAVLTRSVKLVVENEIFEETVEVDKEQDTEIFRTASSTGTSYVIRDMKNGLSAYRFDGDEKCYILYESLEESEDTKELSEDLEQMEEGELDFAERRAETFLSVDEDRGQVDRSVLSAGMAEFCSGLEAHWAVKSKFEPTPSPTPAAEEEEEEAPLMEMEAPSGTNGTNEVQQREKRYVLAHVCYWTTRNVCSRSCSRVCGKRRRRALSDGEPEQETMTRVKRRSWFRRVVRRVVTAVCSAVCRWGCRIVRVKVCTLVG